MVMEYKIKFPDDIKVGDIITIVGKGNNGFKAKLNNRVEIIFSPAAGAFADVPSPASSSPPLRGDLEVKPIEGWILVEQNERWEKQWVFMKKAGAAYKIGIFKSEQEKIEKCRKGGDPFLDDILNIQQVEVVHSEKHNNKSATEQPLKFKVHTPSRTLHIIVASRDKMNERTKEFAAAFQAKVPPVSPNSGPHFNFVSTTSLATRAPLVTAQSHTPSPSHSPSPSNGASKDGGSKWFNIKGLKSNLNVAKGKDSVPSPPLEAVQQPPPSRGMRKSSSLTDIKGAAAPSAKSVFVQPQQGSFKNRFIARVHWRDGTYRTVPITPGLTAKEVCELATKKTKIALFENLFYLYEKFANGDERILDHKTDVYELILSWGPGSDNQLICDLNLDTKNTVKHKMQAGTGAKQNDYASYDDSYDAYDSKYGSMDLDDLARYSDDDKGLEAMIQEMVKLKNQLREEDELLHAIEVEEQQVDMLIARLAQL